MFRSKETRATKQNTTRGQQKTEQPKKLAKSSNKASALSHTLLNLTGQADFHRKPTSFLMEAINQGEEEEEEEEEEGQ